MHVAIIGDLLHRSIPFFKMSQGNKNTPTANRSDYELAVANHRKVRRRQAAQFSKRRMTVLKKVHELYRDCNVDIYLCLRSRRNNQMWLYSNGFIPPNAADIVSLIEFKVIIEFMIANLITRSILFLYISDLQALMTPITRSRSPLREQPSRTSRTAWAGSAHLQLASLV